MVIRPSTHSSASSLPKSEESRPREQRTFSVGPYEVHDFIGTSKTGHVFRARHEQLQHTVALKVLPLPTTENETDKRWSVDTTSKFTKHIESASRVVHDNVVRPIHLGEQNDVHYVAMEYVDGVSLQTILRRESTLRPELACEITLQIANGLRQIHENGLVHGAIRPANVLLTEDGTFKILELGISEITEANDGNEEVRYLAPEQIEANSVTSNRSKSPATSEGTDSEQAVDPRVDIFSLGCILYELIYGTPAFTSEKRDRAPLALGGGHNVQLSAMLSATLSGMLANEPRKRVQSATDVIHAMRNWADGDNIEALVSSHIHQADIWKVSDAITAESRQNADSQTLEGDRTESAGPLEAQQCDDDWDDANMDWALLEEVDTNSCDSFQLPAVREVPNRSLTPFNVAVVSCVFAIFSFGTLALVGFRSEPNAPISTPGQTQPVASSENAAITTKPDVQEVAIDEPLIGSYHDRLANFLRSQHGLPAGAWVLSNNENTCLNDAVHYGHMVTQSSVHGMDFTRAVQMIVEDRGGAAWDAGYFVPGITGLEKDDRLLLAVWLRTESVQGQEGRTGTLRLFCEEEDTDNKDFYIPVRPTSEWQRYLIPFRSRSDGVRRVGFHLAYTRQTIEFGGLALLNYGASIPFAHLPHELHSEEALDLFR